MIFNIKALKMNKNDRHIHNEELCERIYAAETKYPKEIEKQKNDCLSQNRFYHNRIFMELCHQIV